MVQLSRNTPARIRVAGRPGFSLIEMLVVISIIALLVSFLLPALGKSRASAEQMLCATNQRSIQLAAALYATDFQGWYPVNGNIDDASIAGWAIGWDDRLSDYDGRYMTLAEKTGASTWTGYRSGILETEVRGGQQSYGEHLRCPVDQRQPQLSGPGGFILKSYAPTQYVDTNSTDDAGGAWSLEWHGIIGWSTTSVLVPGSSWAGASRNEDQITRPSDAITFTEDHSTDTEDLLWRSRATIGRAHGYDGVTAAFQNNIASFGRIIHGGVGTFNYAFADGHVSAMNFDDTLEGANAGINDVRGSIWDAVRD